MLRVGLDVSPLALTQAGTARYVTCSWTSSSSRRGRAAPLSLGRLGPLDEASHATWSGTRRAARCGAGDAVDFLHCTTMRAPFRSRVPLVVTIHDVAVLRSPETFNALDAPLQPLRRCPGWRGRPTRSSSAPTSQRDELVEPLHGPRSRSARHPVRRRRRRSLPRARPRRATTCSPSPRSSRARTCPARRGLPPRGARRARAAHRRRRRAGATCEVDGDRVRCARATSTTRSSRGSTAAPPPSSTSRSTRGSGCPCSRRWPAARRSSRRPARRSTSSRDGVAVRGRSARPRLDRARRCSEAVARRAHSRSARERAADFTLGAHRARTLDVYREVAA